MCREAMLVGTLVDGAVMVVQANVTRREAAKRVADDLRAASARLLGAVLSNRTFPIPAPIYRRL
jgi:Mrp family chromosome partitioning ATPase